VSAVNPHVKTIGQRLSSIIGAGLRELGMMSDSQEAMALISAACGKARIALLSKESFLRLCAEVWDRCDEGRTPGQTRALDFDFDGDNQLAALARGEKGTHHG
jgi:hypothetical protein